MANISYLIKRVLQMNYKQMFVKINDIHKATGKNHLAIMNDIRKCAVKYGAGYMDYHLFEMYNLTDEQRETYLTRGRNNEIMAKLNNKEYLHYFVYKHEFYQMFDQYLGRSWKCLKADNKEEIKQWIIEHPNFIAKPSGESCGSGVEKISLSNYRSVDECVEYLYTDGKGVVEEIVTQDPTVASLHPNSINTIRVVTVYNKEKDKVHIIYTGARIGNNNKSVDNFNNGGMTTPVDIETGIVLQPAIDKNKVLYDVHPITGTKIKDFKYPYWKEMLEMIDRCARIIPEMGYVGWDVAMSDKGPVLIEGNDFPGHDIYQLPQHTPNKIGVYPKFLEAIE